MRATRLLTIAVFAVLVISSVTVATAGFDLPPGDVLVRHAITQPVVLGDSFTYQGRLTESGGPASGTYDFRFILYDAESGGTQVGTTFPVNDVAVAGGLFAVNLDFGASSFDGNARWLEIAVRPGSSTGSYTVLSPRQPIGSTPYALYAKASGGIAVPFSSAGSSAGDLFAVTQYGYGAGLTVNRAPATVATATTSPSPSASPSPTPVPGPAIRGVNSGPGAGVQGETTYSSGTGGSFSGYGAGTTALEVRNGALRMPAGYSPVVVHEVRIASSTNTCDSLKVSVITDPMTDGDASAALLVTLYDPTPASLDPSPSFGVIYNYTAGSGCAALGANKWAIFSNSGLSEGQKFNVLVIKR